MGVLRVKVNGQWVDVGTSVPQPNRNLLDNGQMAVKQRAITSLAFGSGSVADRWLALDSGVGAALLNYIPSSSFAAWTLTGKPRPANVQYIVMTTAEAAGALAATDFMQWRQIIEGQFLQHLNWGTVEAQPLTYSFDTYSSVAATYVVTLYRNESTTRHISKLLPVPGGWSSQSMTFPGDITNPITNDNMGRLYCSVWLAAGSAFTSGTLQTSWGNSVDVNLAPGIGNQFPTAVNNAFALTNAQLEVGSQATPYEVRDYGQELAKCKRYYEVTGYVLNPTVPPYVAGYWTVQKRTLPTITHVPQGGTGAVFNTTDSSIFYQNSAHTVASITVVTGSAEF